MILFLFVCLQAIFFTFRLDMWIVLGIALLAFGLLLKITRTYDSPFFWLMFSLFGKGQDSGVPQYLPQYFITFFWSLAATIISLAFTCSLVASLSVLTVEKLPSTFNELLESDYLILSSYDPVVKGGNTAIDGILDVRASWQVDYLAACYWFRFFSLRTLVIPYDIQHIQHSKVEVCTVK